MWHFLKMDKIFNLLIILSEIPGFSIVLKKDGLKTFIYYTEISNLLALIAAFMVLLEVPGAEFLRYTATCMLSLTFLVVVLVLGPADGYKRQLFAENSFFQHVLAPVFSFVSYVFFEKHTHIWTLPVLITIIYGLLMFFLNYLKKIEGPYPFFDVHKQGIKASIMWFLALFLMIAAVSGLLIAIAG